MKNEATSHNTINLLGNKNNNAIAGWQNKRICTYTDLAHQIYSWQQTIKKSNHQKIALYIHDTLTFTAAFIGCLRAGVTPYLPSNTLPTTCAQLSQLVDGFVGDFSPNLKPLQIDTTQSTCIKHDEKVAFCVPSLAQFVVFTSGSTGEPTAISKFVTQFTREVSTLERTFGGFRPNIRIVSTVTHHHIYGLLFKVFWPLSCNYPIYAENLNYPEQLITYAENHHLALISSPAHLKRFVQSDLFQNNSYHLDALFSSGGPLDRDTALACQPLFGLTPTEIFGSSETGGVAWRKRSSQLDESWTPLNGVLWRLNPNTDTLDISSPHMSDMQWFSMADRIRYINNHRFELIGRQDKIVKIEEKRVSLTALERTIAESPLVENVRVIVITMDKTKRQRLAAFIVLSSIGKDYLSQHGKLSLNRTIRQHLLPTFEPVTLPKLWRYIEALPINSQGKTAYADLLALLQEK